MNRPLWRCSVRSVRVSPSTHMAPSGSLNQESCAERLRRLLAKPRPTVGGLGLQRLGRETPSCLICIRVLPSHPVHSHPLGHVTPQGSCCQREERPVRQLMTSTKCHTGFVRHSNGAHNAVANDTSERGQVSLRSLEEPWKGVVSLHATAKCDAIILTGCLRSVVSVTGTHW